MTESVSPASREVGERIRQIRERRGLTMKAFGDAIGVSHSFVSVVERGLNRPSMELLQGLARAFAANVNWVLTGQGPVFISAIEAPAAAPPTAPVPPGARAPDEDRKPAHPPEYYRDLVERLKDMLLERAERVGVPEREERAVFRLRAVFRSGNEGDIALAEGLLERLAPSESSERPTAGAKSA